MEPMAPTLSAIYQSCRSPAVSIGQTFFNLLLIHCKFSPLELYGNIFDHLSPLDIICAGRVSKLWRNAANAYFAFSFTQFMLRYFTPDEVLGFRTIQETQGALISGSSAIQFFERSVIEESDLDVYVEHRNTLVLGLFLQSIGYSFIPRSNHLAHYPDYVPSFEEVFNSLSDNLARQYPTIYPMKGIGSVYDFKRGERTVQVITTKGPVMEVILSFHSSVYPLILTLFPSSSSFLGAPLNIITHSHAYSLYPKATFDEKRSLILRATYDGQRHEDARAKYRVRGWRLLPYVSCHEATHPECEFSAGPRWVGDSKCMTVQLPPSGAAPSPNPHIWPSNSWKLEFDLDNTARMKCRHTYETDKWKYCIAEKGLEDVLDIPTIKTLMQRFHWYVFVGYGSPTSHFLL